MPYLTRQKLNSLLMAGHMMSNICFNLKQNPAIDKVRAGTTDSMNAAQKEWDEVSRGLAYTRKRKSDV